MWLLGMLTVPPLAARLLAARPLAARPLDASVIEACLLGSTDGEGAARLIILSSERADAGSGAPIEAAGEVERCSVCSTDGEGAGSAT